MPNWLIFDEVISRTKMFHIFGPPCMIEERWSGHKEQMFIFHAKC